MRVFLSHNRGDKTVARKVGAHLILSGIDVWFDEWEIQAGDSIPGKLNEGLADFDAFVLLWSESAARSNWVRQELQSAIMRVIQDESAKIVPCLLDDTELPPLIADRCWIDFSDNREGITKLLNNLSGQQTKGARLLAIQSALEDMDVKWIIHPSLPPMVCCPKCGETEALTPWQHIDKYGSNFGMQCTNCGWSDGGEI